MLLILYDKSDLSTIDYIQYLRNHKIAHHAIEAESMVNDFAIEDNSSSCIWVHQATKEKVDFSTIKGIYYRIFELQQQLFKDYQQEDQEYVCKEWWSYLVYIIYKHDNCINPISLLSMSGLLLQFGFYFDLALKYNIDIPSYYISTDLKMLQEKFDQKSLSQQYIIKQSASNNTNFLTRDILPDNAMSMIEKPKGDMVIVHFIDGKFFAVKVQNNTKAAFEIDNKLKKSCIKMAQDLDCRVLQYIFICDNQKMILMHLSNYPNWLHNTDDNKHQIYLLLTQILQNQ